jgi:hypothetical protein
MTRCRRQFVSALLAPALACLAVAGRGGGAREAGEFRIFMGGAEIGSEKYVLVAERDTVQSTSVITFRNPQNARQRISLETRLTMTPEYTPVGYELKSDVDGKKGTIVGKFSPNQAVFEYGGAGDSARRGLLVGERYTILDTNVFHHYIFLARLYLQKGKEKAEKYEVVVPQENESGFLAIAELGRETAEVRGKKVKLRHLRVDSGALQIELWVNNAGLLERISVPARGIEVVRSE